MNSSYYQRAYRMQAAAMSGDEQCINSPDGVYKNACRVDDNIYYITTSISDAAVSLGNKDPWALWSEAGTRGSGLQAINRVLYEHTMQLRRICVLHCL